MNSPANGEALEVSGRTPVGILVQQVFTSGEKTGKNPRHLPLVPAFDLHIGFPCSSENQLREYVDPRNVYGLARFASVDHQVTKEIHFPIVHKDRSAQVRFGVFNVLNQFNPRDVQNDLDACRFGAFSNSPTRSFTGKPGLGF